MAVSSMFCWTYAVVFVVFGVVLRGTLAETCSDATNVCHNYDSESNNKLQSQVLKELQASYIYQSYAYFFGRSDIALPGIAKFFARESLEERSHADHLIEYINKRGGRIVFKDIKYSEICQLLNRNISICKLILGNVTATNLKHGLLAFQDALALEKIVSGSLEGIIADDDFQLNHFIENEYLDEQVDTIKILGDYVRQLEMFSDEQYTMGQYIFDKNLLKSMKHGKDKEDMSKLY